MNKPDTPRENPALLQDERIRGEAARPELENRVPDQPHKRERTKPHDAGSDVNDTIDGLTESEEAARHAAEDIPTGQDPADSAESVPVFDRGSLPPKA